MGLVAGISCIPGILRIPVPAGGIHPFRLCGESNARRLRVERVTLEVRAMPQVVLRDGSIPVGGIETAGLAHLVREKDRIVERHVGNRQGIALARRNKAATHHRLVLPAGHLAARKRKGVIELHQHARALAYRSRRDIGPQINGIANGVELHKACQRVRSVRRIDRRKRFLWRIFRAARK